MNSEALTTFSWTALSIALCLYIISLIMIILEGKKLDKINSNRTGK